MWERKKSTPAGGWQERLLRWKDGTNKVNWFSVVGGGGTVNSKDHKRTSLLAQEHASGSG